MCPRVGGALTLLGPAPQVSSLDRATATAAVASLWQLTLPTRPNCAANQAGLVALGGVDVVLEYACVRLEGSEASAEDADEAVMALLVSARGPQPVRSPSAARPQRRATCERGRAPGGDVGLPERRACA